MFGDSTSFGRTSILSLSLSLVVRHRYHRTGSDPSATYTQRETFANVNRNNCSDSRQDGVKSIGYEYTVLKRHKSYAKRLDMYICFLLLTGEMKTTHTLTS